MHDFNDREWWLRRWTEVQTEGPPYLTYPPELFEYRGNRGYCKRCGSICNTFHMCDDLQEHLRRVEKEENE